VQTDGKRLIQIVAIVTDFTLFSAAGLAFNNVMATSKRQKELNMKKILMTAAGLMTGATLMLCSSSAMAHGRVDWSVSIGVPAYAPPPVVYAAPPVVYEAPVPVVRYRPQPYYVYPAYGYRDPYWRHRAWREHEWREHARREHQEHRGHH
jgi:hypothetical protein